MAKEFVQHVKITGDEEAIVKLRALGFQVEELGEGTQDAGKKGQNAGEQMAAGFTRWIAAAAGIGAIKRLLDQYLETLHETVRVQDELAGKATTLAGSGKTLARQLGVDESTGASVLTSLRIAGGLDAGAASALGIALDIGFSDLGGLLAGQNLQTGKDLAAFMGAAGFVGDEGAKLVEVLKAAGQLGSPEAAKQATAQIAAAARASKASSIGAFSGQLARGAIPFLQAGVPLEDVLELAGQFRQVEVNEQLAATGMEQFYALAVSGVSKSFDRDVAREARDRGLDARELTAADRINIARDLIRRISTPKEQRRFLRQAGPERGIAIQKALGAENVAVTEPVGEAARAATLAEFELEVERGNRELSKREAQNQAAQEFEDYQAGLETATISWARARAKAAVDRDIATGRVQAVVGWVREGREESYVRQLFEDTIGGLKLQNVDVSRAEAALSNLGVWDPKFGYKDADLFSIAREIDEARRRSSLNRQAELREDIKEQRGLRDEPAADDEERAQGETLNQSIDRLRESIDRQTEQRAQDAGKPQVTINNNIGTAYLEQDPLRDPPVPLDRND